MPSTQPRTHARRVDRIAASAIAAHESTLSSVIALAIFLPIISDMSGGIVKLSWQLAD
jgi:hypothetical protein